MAAPRTGLLSRVGRWLYARAYKAGWGETPTETIARGQREIAEIAGWDTGNILADLIRGVRRDEDER